MPSLTCVVCHFPIPPGAAVLRSMGLRRVVAWHKACRPGVIPSQRRPEGEKVDR